MRCIRKPLSPSGFLAISCEWHLLIAASPMSLCQGDYQIETSLVHLSFSVRRSKANTKHRWTRWPTCFSISCSSKELQWFGAAVEQKVEQLSTNHPQPLQSTCGSVLGEDTELQMTLIRECLWMILCHWWACVTLDCSLCHAIVSMCECWLVLGSSLIKGKLVANYFDHWLINWVVCQAKLSKHLLVPASWM